MKFTCLPTLMLFLAADWKHAAASHLRGLSVMPAGCEGTCQTMWGQCGGMNWNGPTCCESGTGCVEGDAYYSQCKPGAFNECDAFTTTTTSTLGCSGSCQAEWAQCGGMNWNGPTCCVTGTGCVFGDDYYSQCQPGAYNPCDAFTTTTTTTLGCSGPCQAAWAQCGGLDWNGPTCCVAGTGCVFGDAYYSQCQPDAFNACDGVTAATQTTTTTTTTTTTITTTTTTTSASTTTTSTRTTTTTTTSTATTTTTTTATTATTTTTTTATSTTTTTMTTASTATSITTATTTSTTTSTITTTTSTTSTSASTSTSTSSSSASTASSATSTSTMSTESTKSSPTSSSTSTETSASTSTSSSSQSTASSPTSTSTGSTHTSPTSSSTSTLTTVSSPSSSSPSTASSPTSTSTSTGSTKSSPTSSSTSTLTTVSSPSSSSTHTSTSTSSKTTATATSTTTTTTTTASATSTSSSTSNSSSTSTSTSTTTTTTRSFAGPYAIAGFSLVDASSDTIIASYDPLESGAVLELEKLPSGLNIVAHAAPAVQSVRFQLSGAQTLRRVENVAPYAMYGDANGDFHPWSPSVGSYGLTATGWSADAAQGESGESLTIHFTVVEGTTATTTSTMSTAVSTSTTTSTSTSTSTTSSTSTFGDLTITSLLLIEVTSQSVIGTLDDGATLVRDEMDYRGINVEAIAGPAVESVFFDLSGVESHRRVESIVPYALQGDFGGNGIFRPWLPRRGDYSLTVTGYSENGREGVAGTPLTIQFTVV